MYRSDIPNTALAILVTHNALLKTACKILQGKAADKAYNCSTSTDEVETTTVTKVHIMSWLIMLAH